MSPEQFRVHRLHPQGLDPITVYIEQYRPGSSRITVQCYAQAWTAYWGSHGDNPVEQFVCSCDVGYVADALRWGQQGLMTKLQDKHQQRYVERIVSAIKAEFAAKGGAA